MGEVLVTQELEKVEPNKYVGFLNPQTGELMSPTVDNADTAISACRAMKEHANALVNEVTDWLVAMSEHQGTKTLRGERATITISGGPTVDYDASDLMEALAEAGCPEERINAAVIPVVTYKIDRAVLRQLAAANPDYRAAIELAERQVEKPYRASLKLRRQDDQ